MGHEDRACVRAIRREEKRKFIAILRERAERINEGVRAGEMELIGPAGVVLSLLADELEQELNQ